MPISLDQFTRNLSQSGLMAAAEIQGFMSSLPPAERPGDGDTLAARLVQAGKLTNYQVAAVCQGKGASLLFGDYVILDKLGQGGMGVVLKARHRRMRRLVAIKMISRAMMKSPDAVKRFYREVEAAARLEHPNIVTAYDASEHDGVHYFAMQYVEGKDLAAVVKDHGPLGVRQAVECILQAARGLQYAHEQGIVHRDIKPANLLLDRKGTVKILDMGLARMEQAAMEERGGDRLTQSGQVMGTGDYMAPEQALNTHEADARSDIYSLGCTLYRLLTGQPPYKGEIFTQLFLAHREAPIPSLCEARPEVPGELDAIFRKMIAKCAHERQQSMTEVIADLEGFLSACRRAPMEEEPSSEGALAFLREFTEGATGTRQKARAKVEHTFDNNGRPETGKDIHERLFWGLDRRKALAIGLGVGAVVLVGALALGIVITIRGRDGRKTTLRVPEGSQVAVSQGGQVDVTLSSFPVSRNGRGAGAEGAAQLQKQWAARLGLPLEVTNSIGMKLVLISPGEFEMGSTPEEIEWALAEGKAKFPTDKYYFDRVPGEGPRHRVKITKPFYVAVYPVTQGEYEKVMGINPSAFTEKQVGVSTFQPPLSEGEAKVRPGDAKRVAGQDTSRHPVETVSWDDCQEFCRRLSSMPEEQKARREYRLPTEAEWEYACRAGTTTRWCCGDDEDGLLDVAWFNKNAGGMTHAVGQKKPNAWGLYDMHGNVWQWCADYYDKDYYRQSPGTDPTGPTTGSIRVARGGYGGAAAYCRSAFRYNHGPGD
ncbi:MAG: bifunctional serine/threonine-protein kinase/formylglycine-generating enzyme family protein, partial [Phycisphaerales bacterium]